MTDATFKTRLVDLVGRHFAAWQPAPATRVAFDALSELQAAALFRALLAERDGNCSFAGPAANCSDLNAFGLRVNEIFCGLLASRTPIDSLTVPGDSGIFARHAGTEASEQATLLRDGYLVSGQRLDESRLARIRDDIAGCVFVNKGIFTREAKGSRILAGIADGRLTGRPSKNGDTYWLKDETELAGMDSFAELAFDPYILSTVARYLGCCPIHVQTNLWFSFPTFRDKWNLSANAQMFHQDKEFTKFIKVFVYLSDVGQGNGPHCYIAGSHADEAHTLGVPLSQRIPDDEIDRYYAAGRIRKLIGPAGTLAFGDTSCVHKGMPVQSGYRAILQLEYAASLYLSPVSPFRDMPDPTRKRLPYPAPVTARLLANYSSPQRELYQQMEKNKDVVVPQSLVRKLVRLGKRYLPQASRGEGI